MPRRSNNPVQAKLEEFIETLPPPDTAPVLASRHKFKVSPKDERTAQDGLVFHSKAEMKAYEYLLTILPKEDILLQPKFVLLDAFVDHNGTKQRAITYNGDFLIARNAATRAKGEFKKGDIIIDIKGMVTPIYELKKKMFYSRYPLDILEIKSMKQLKLLGLENRTL